MPNPVTETGQFKYLISTATVYTGTAQLLGLLCATTTSGTAIVYDATSATNQITGTITLTAGQWYPIPATCVTGIRVVLANAAGVTVFFNPA